MQFSCLPVSKVLVEGLVPGVSGVGVVVTALGADTAPQH